MERGCGGVDDREYDQSDGEGSGFGPDEGDGEKEGVGSDDEGRGSECSPVCIGLKDVASIGGNEENWNDNAGAFYGGFTLFRGKL